MSIVGEPDLGAARDDLVRICVGRELSPAARDDCERLLGFGDGSESRDVVAHLLAKTAPRSFDRSNENDNDNNSNANTNSPNSNSSTPSPTRQSAPLSPDVLDVEVVAHKVTVPSRLTLPVRLRKPLVVTSGY